MNVLLWGILPYVMMAVLIGGLIWRYRYDQFGWTTRSSQLYESRLLRIGSPLFHFGILVVIMGHLGGLVIPKSWTEAVGITEGIYHFNALLWGTLAGVCTLVVIDLIDIPAAALRRLPASTWFRVERAIEGSDTAVLILAAMPVARSAGGRSIAMEGTGNRVIWKGGHDRSRRIAGVRTRAAVNAARWSHAQSVDLETVVTNAV